jgi:amino acid transporter
MEYAVGNIAVAISWSDYFTGFFNGMGMHIPEYFSVDYLTASRGYETVMNQMQQGVPFSQISGALREAFTAWSNAPQLFGFRLIADIPAFAVVVFITILVYRGIRESKIASNIMVLLKVSILLVVIAVGAFWVNPENWSPFAPNGIAGVLKGVSGVFFAYIGFDAISTTAEECKNPQRDIPRSIFYALIITTVLYIVISLVLTGMVHYSELAVGDPLAYVFGKLHLTRLSGIIAISAIVAMASVLLVFQMGQPRIWMSMSRDGLLPKRFSKLHPKFKTPAFSTILTGILVAVPSLFLNITEVTDLTSIGTLFAFVLVSGGVLVLDAKDGRQHETDKRVFRIPYFNSRWFLPPLWIVTLILVFSLNTNGILRFFSAIDLLKPDAGWWEVFRHKIPMILFIVVSSVLTIAAVIKKFSLIPVLGLLTNLFLMTELGITNWLRFLIWLLIGLSLYFTYGFKNSKLRSKSR